MFKSKQPSVIESQLVYPEILIFWKNKHGESEVKLYHKTLKDAYNIAIKLGYQPPKWYTPWRYFTGGLGIVTIGFGEVRAH